MSPPLEKDIERKVCDYAKKLGCYTRKYTSPAQRGVPDRIIIAPGGAVGFLELKRPGNKPTPLQLKEMRTLTEVGCTVDWVDNVEAGKAFVDGLVAKGKALTEGGWL